MQQSVEIDALDRSLVAALLGNPRARVNAIAKVACTSPATVSRRLAELESSGRVRVIAVIDHQRARRGFAVFLRLRCRPGTSAEVARALATWPEAGYVNVLGGDLDCMAQISARSNAHLLHMMTVQIPALPGILQSSTLRIIRRYSTPHTWTAGLADERSLQSIRADRLDHWSETQATAPAALDELDERLAGLLAEDGRATWRELAERTGVLPATARRRVETLMTRGVLRFRAVVQPALVGRPVIAFLWMRVSPTRLEVVGNTLAAHPDVVNIAATTGQANLCGEIAVADDTALYEFLTETVGALPGVLAVDVSDGLHVLKRASQTYPEPDSPGAATPSPPPPSDRR